MDHSTPIPDFDPNDLVWCLYDGTYYPAFQNENLNQSQGELQEGTAVAAFFDGSSAVVTNDAMLPFDYTDEAKMNAPEVRQQVNAIMHYMTGEEWDGAQQLTHTQQAEVTQDDQPEKKSKKDKKDKADKKEKKDKKDKADKKEKKDKKDKKEKKEKRAREAAADDEDLLALLDDDREDEAPKMSKKRSDDAADPIRSRFAKAHGDDDDLDEMASIEGDSDLGEGKSYRYTNTKDAAAKPRGGAPQSIARRFVAPATGAAFTTSDFAITSMPRSIQAEVNGIRILFHRLTDADCESGEKILAVQEVDVLRHFEGRLLRNRRALEVLETLYDKAEGEARTKLKESMDAIKAYRPEEELEKMTLTVEKKRRENAKVANSKLARMRDPLMGPRPLPTIEEEVVEGALDGMVVDGPAGFAVPTPGGGSQLARSGSALLSAASGSGIDLMGTGLQHTGVMNQWLAFRDYVKAPTRDAMSVEAFGAVSRRYNAGAKRISTRVKDRAIHLGMEEPQMERGDTRTSEIDFCKFELEPIDKFDHPDGSAIASSQMQSELDSIPMSEGDSRGESVSHASEVGFVSAVASEFALPSVSAMWAGGETGTTTPFSASTGSATGSRGGSAARNSGKADRPQSWRNAARQLISRALTPFYRGTHGSPKVLDDDTFRAAGQEILQRVYARALEIRQQPGTTRGQLLASDLNEDDKVKIHASAVHYVRRRYVEGRGPKNQSASAHRPGSSSYHGAPTGAAGVNRSASYHTGRSSRSSRSGYSSSYYSHATSASYTPYSEV